MTTTLEHWLAHSAASQPVQDAVAAIAASCARIAAVLRTAPIAGQTGLAGHTNVQGEAQKQLDVVSNDLVVEALRACPHVRVLVSEELDDALPLSPSGTLLVATDPLDGSSNLDVNVTVGTIFSLLPAEGDTPNLLQPGTAQLAAGYAAYGPATSLVLSVGAGVAVFTLDAASTFVLTADTLEVPAQSGEYAINAARARFWDAPTAAYVAENVAGETGAAGQRYNMRWVGSMVADIHRILQRGGIFLYPLDSETIAKGGRLRLLYEANPMAFLMRAAGGRATTGTADILSLVPTDIHQRVAVILGSADEVARVEAHYRASP